MDIGAGLTCLPIKINIIFLSKIAAYSSQQSNPFDIVHNLKLFSTLHNCI